MSRFDLSESDWRIIQPLLPNKPRGAPRVDDRRVMNEIFFVVRTGSPWRDLPERYGPYTTVYTRFNRWRQAGGVGSTYGRDYSRLRRARADDDSSSVRVHQHAAGSKKTVELAIWAAPETD